MMQCGNYRGSLHTLRLLISHPTLVPWVGFSTEILLINSKSLDCSIIEYQLFIAVRSLNDHNGRKHFSSFRWGVPYIKPFNSPRLTVGVMHLRTGRPQGGGCASMSKSGTVWGELRELSWGDGDARLRRGITHVTSQASDPSSPTLKRDCAACAVSNAYRHTRRMQPHARTHAATHTFCSHLHPVRKLAMFKTKAEFTCCHWHTREML